MKGLRSGDEAVLERLMRKHQKKLFSVSLGICKNVEDAEEVLQDVYMIAMCRIDQFKRRSSLSTWLYRVTVNTSLMKLRREKKNRRNLSLDDNANSPEARSGWSSSLRAKSPSEELLARDKYRVIHDAAESLPEKYQQVFYLRDVFGFSIRETSRALDISPAATKSRLHRCRVVIRKRIVDPQAVAG